MCFIIFKRYYFNKNLADNTNFLKINIVPHGYIKNYK